MKQILFLPLIFALFLISCLSQTKHTQRKSHPRLLITIRRAVTFGPGDLGRIYEDGTVVYDNKDFSIGSKGKRRYRISKEKVNELIEEFKKINYFSLRDIYRSRIDDGGTTITSVLIDGKRKEISNDSDGGPEELYELEYKIDAVAGFTNFFHIWRRKVLFCAYLLAHPAARGSIVNYGTKEKIAKRVTEIKSSGFGEFDINRVEFVRHARNSGVKTEFRIVNGEKTINF